MTMMNYMRIVLAGLVVGCIMAPSFSSNAAEENSAYRRNLHDTSVLLLESHPAAAGLGRLIGDTNLADHPRLDLIGSLEADEIIECSTSAGVEFPLSVLFTDEDSIHLRRLSNNRDEDGGKGPASARLIVAAVGDENESQFAVGLVCLPSGEVEGDLRYEAYILSIVDQRQLPRIDDELNERITSCWLEYTGRIIQLRMREREAINELMRKIEGVNARSSEGEISRQDASVELRLLLEEHSAIRLEFRNKRRLLRAEWDACVRGDRELRN